MSSIIVPLEKESDVAFARDEAAAVAHAMGFDRLTAGQIMLAVSEICQNVIRYAEEGHAEISTHNADRVLRIVVMDEGPGIPDIDQAMQEGFSSDQTSWGIGLKAAKNSMDRFEIESTPGSGTKVLLEKYLPLSQSTFDFGVVSMADENYTVNGDEFFMKEFDGNKVFIGAIDGLGQGKPAQEMAGAVKILLQNHFREPLPELIRLCNEKLKDHSFLPGGVAMSVAIVAPGMLDYLGVGDTHAYLLDGVMHPLQNIGGRVGARQLRSLKVEKFPLKDAVIFVLCTDGIYSRIQYGELDIDQSAQQIANQIFNLYNRPYGDATVLVAKYNSYDSE